jgi:bifunctional DNase/RNase
MRQTHNRAQSAGSAAAAGTPVATFRIARLVDETYFAEIIVKGAHGTQAVHTRPSDAVALTLITRVPIRVERGVLDAAGEALCRDIAGT